MNVKQLYDALGDFMKMSDKAANFELCLLNYKAEHVIDGFVEIERVMCGALDGDHVIIIPKELITKL